MSYSLLLVLVKVTKKRRGGVKKSPKYKKSLRNVQKGHAWKCIWHQIK